MKNYSLSAFYFPQKNEWNQLYIDQLKRYLGKNVVKLLYES